MGCKLNWLLDLRRGLATHDKHVTPELGEWIPCAIFRNSILLYSMGPGAWVLEF